MGATFVGITLLLQFLSILWFRFKAERKRQLIITRPRAKARLGGSTVIEAEKSPNNGEKAYLARLHRPYSYFQQAEKIEGTNVAPGEMKIRPRQREALEKYLLRHDVVYAFVDPNGEDQAYLTPGPQLLSWSYIGKSIGIILLAALLSWWLSNGVASIVVMVTAMGVLLNQFGVSYSGSLEDWIEVVAAEEEKEGLARPQVQEEEVVEAMELRELADNRLKGL